MDHGEDENDSIHQLESVDQIEDFASLTMRQGTQDELKKTSNSLFKTEATLRENSK